MLTARSAAEAHLFMDLSPCRCGANAFDRDHSLVARGDDLIARYEGDCAGCGARRVFEFAMAEPVHQGRQLTFGGDRPSQLIDPAQFLAVADDAAQRVPPDLEMAVAALDEVIKFIPAGHDAVPESAISGSGRSYYQLEPGRFRRSRLEAVRKAYLDLLGRPS